MIRVALLPGSRALALPAGGSVGAGVTSITTPSATEMSINQESGHSIINWNSFGIGKNETVNIVQPTSDATLLNRVLGNSPSEIFGRLTANGRVFLVNQNGILFGPTASVNVGGLVASTLAISDQDFLSGKYLFSRSGSTAAVVNQGSLHGGFIALLGGSVKQSGSLVTTKGAAVMASGEGVTLDIDPFGMIAIRVDPATYNAQIENSGIIEAEEGTVVMSAPARDALVATVVNNSGQLLTLQCSADNITWTPVAINNGASVTFPSGFAVSVTMGTGLNYRLASATAIVAGGTVWVAR